MRAQYVCARHEYWYYVQYSLPRFLRNLNTLPALQAGTAP
jgi:hypothetical protein